MDPLEKALSAAGYRVCNVAYPSRDYSVDVLARRFVAPAVKRCFPGHEGSVNFVTHSMGGIVVRQLAALGDMPRIGRVVMLGPPNQGSEAVDALGALRIFRWIGGPAGQTLGTSAGALPRTLGPVHFELGVIAGSRSFNPWLSSLLLPGQDDGKVTVAGTRVEGMKDFVVLPTTHVFMMRSPEVIRQTLHFLAHGCFRAPAESGATENKKAA
jgi:pimeloyl-ACP methyl ester carboxylesterase